MAVPPPNQAAGEGLGTGGADKTKPTGAALPMGTAVKTKPTGFGPAGLESTGIVMKQGDFCKLKGQGQPFSNNWTENRQVA